MRAASTAALRALSTPTQATGTPGGIWAIDRSASRPPATEMHRQANDPSLAVVVDPRHDVLDLAEALSRGVNKRTLDQR